ncbi:MAG: YitT family protein, partial [Bacteroidia bacterium]|nr:YitT family protein [Bacteroidia bacterium]
MFHKAIRLVKQAFWVSSGILSAVIGLQGFLLPNQFIDGGVTGVSMLVSAITGLNISWLLVLINAPFIAIGFRQISWQFAIRSGISITMLAVVIHSVHIEPVTQDKLLASIFGGIFLGAGIGLAIRGGTVVDGTEIIALVLSKKTGLTVGDIIMIFNVILFLIAGWLLGIERGMYSILTYFAASKMVDFLLHGLEEYTGITIISKQVEEIRKKIIQDTGRGVTIYRGKGGFSGNEQDILFCIVTRLEIYQIKNIVAETDS